MTLLTLLFIVLVTALVFFHIGAWATLSACEDEGFVIPSKRSPRPSMRQPEPVYAGNVIEFRRGQDFVRV